MPPSPPDPEGVAYPHRRLGVGRGRCPPGADLRIGIMALKEHPTRVDPGFNLKGSLAPWVAMRPLQGRSRIGVANRGRRAPKACPCPRLLHRTPSGFFSCQLHPRCPAEDMGKDQPMGERVSRCIGTGEGSLPKFGRPPGDRVPESSNYRCLPGKAGDRSFFISVARTGPSPMTVQVNLRVADHPPGAIVRHIRA